MYELKHHTTESSSIIMIMPGGVIMVIFTDIHVVMQSRLYNMHEQALKQ